MVCLHWALLWCWWWNSNGSKGKLNTASKNFKSILLLKYNKFFTNFFCNYFPFFSNFFWTLSIFFLPRLYQFCLFKLLVLNILTWHCDGFFKKLSVCLQNVELQYFQYDCSVWMYDNSMFCKHSENSAFTI